MQNGSPDVKQTCCFANIPRQRRLAIIPLIAIPPNLAITFPVYLHLGRYSIHPHLFFESISYVVGFRVYLSLRRRFGDAIITPLRWAVIAAAIAGAAIGAKLLYWLEDPQLT